jgi:hypothetical protein
MTKTIDITSEEYRIYTYGTGQTFRIDEPAEIHILADENGVSHRVIDKSGVTHRPERGWIGISWCPREGQPAFVA